VSEFRTRIVKDAVRFGVAFATLWEDCMRNTAVIFALAFLSLASTSPSLALPKGPRGESCNVSSQTGVRHTIHNQTYICDKCVFKRCAGTRKTDCHIVTHYSNCTAGRT
jgi:hypothetical protein